MSPLEELQGLVHSRNVLDVEVRAAAGRALDAGVHRSSVAFALGISRASLYRQFRAGGDDCTGVCSGPHRRSCGTGSVGRGVMRDPYLQFSAEPA